MTKSIVYDYETLGQEPQTAPVLSVAFLEFNDEKFLSKEPYQYDELLGQTFYLKFDVADQVKNYGKKIEKDTMNWWMKQGDAAKKVLKPGPSDVSIAQFYTKLHGYVEKPKSIKAVFTRGNTFDPMFTKYIMKDIGHEDPFAWWAIRDTRSYIDALLIGVDNMDNKFVLPEWQSKFVAHDARHDVVVDVLRMQELVRAIHYDA